MPPLGVPTAGRAWDLEAALAHPLPGAARLEGLRSGSERSRPRKADEQNAASGAGPRRPLRHAGPLRVC